MARVVAILTDFGYRDFYVASMKGVILSICPEVTIVDISHDVPKWDIRSAAYLLFCSYRYFPEGTIFVVVVDPGVGTERNIIAVKTRKYVFIGPDNGVLALAVNSDGIEEIYIVENIELFLKDISYTFHGRDIFAPVAAYLACGVNMEKLGRKSGKIKEVFMSKPYVSSNGILGEIIYIDDFGNAATNIDKSALRAIGIDYGDRIEVYVGDRYYILPFAKSFGYVREGEPLMLINSCGVAEIAVNRGKASEILELNLGAKIRLKKYSQVE